MELFCGRDRLDRLVSERSAEAENTSQRKACSVVMLD